MFRENLLKNKTVLVTGGGTGLGKSMASRFGELGADLIIASRRDHVIKEAAEDLKKIGTKVLGLTCDVRDIDSVKSMVEK